MKGETVEISTIAECDWYEWLKFHDSVSKIQLGRDLGAAIDIGLIMVHKILKANGQVMYRTSVRSLMPDDIHSPSELKECEAFDAVIEEKNGSPMTQADFKDYAGFVSPTFECYEDDEVPASKMMDIDDVKDKDDVDTYDQYDGAQVRVTIGDGILTGKVIRRKHEIYGTLKGRANSNPMLDTSTYEIELPADCSGEYTANVIAENMYAQCDEEGNQFNLMVSIVDHKTDGHVIDRADRYINHGSNTQIRNTTKGWHLCVEWKDGTTSGECLADLKESDPLEVDEYALS
jgi:hypothetical protein